MASSYVLYYYTPNLECAILFAVLFFLTTAVHLYQRIRIHAKYLNPFIVGGIFQIIGYSARAVSHFYIHSTTIYAMQTLFILLAPTLYAASIYMILGRIITALHAQHLSVVPVEWMTKIFVCGDILSFILQGAGGGIMTSGTANDLSIGKWVIIGGLCVQLLFFGTFILAALKFHLRIVKSPTEKSDELRDQRSTRWLRDWSTVLFGCYVISVLILIRSAYRVAEFALGNSGYVMTHEVFMYVFDAAMMFCAMVVLNVFHPSLFLSKTQSV